MAISKLQMQETRAAQLSRELDNLRDEAPSLAMEKARLAERLKEARGGPHVAAVQLPRIARVNWNRGSGR